MEKHIQENDLQGLQAFSGMRSSTQNMVFKLRTLLGERTPKNHSAVKKNIPENELQDLQACSGMRSSTQNMGFQIALCLGRGPRKITAP